MANVQAPFGLAVSRTTNQGAFNAQTNIYYIPSTDGSAYYVGDIVKSTATPGADANGIVSIAKITNGTDTPRGFITGILPAAPSMNTADMRGPDLGLSQVSIPASKSRAYYVMVCDDPDVMFTVQGDGTATNQVAAKASYNCTLTVTAPTTATFPMSATCVNSSTINTTNTLTVRLMGLALLPGNGFGAYATWQAKWNAHELMGGNTAN